MAWTGVVTNAGQALLESYAEGGHTLALVGATVGSGTVDEANLRIQTALTGEKDDASIISAKAVTGGTKFKLQVGPASAQVGAYTAHQIGLWAKLDDGEDTLMLLAQDADTGVSVPLASVSPNFAFAVFAVIAVDNTGSLTVNIDQSAYVTNGTLAAAVAALEASLDGKVDISNSAGFKNSLYRGKYLGTSITAVQYAAISAGTFDDLFIGDYWTINGINWRIAAFDYWLNHGDTACTTHHVVIVPDSNLAYCNMNDTNITTGAYIGSDYYTGANNNTGKATAQSAINNAFGGAHILSHREFLKNTVVNGYESFGEWCDSTFELMTEQMVYGCKVFGNVMNGTNVPASYTIDTSQLPLFRHDHSSICNRALWWLRDVASETHFAGVDNGGSANYHGASYSVGVRPAFGIIG